MSHVAAYIVVQLQRRSGLCCYECIYCIVAVAGIKSYQLL